MEGKKWPKYQCTVRVVQMHMVGGISTPKGSSPPPPPASSMC